jgi:hypothetical protein
MCVSVNREGMGSCREHSPASAQSAHSAQYGSIGQLARGSERAVAGHVQCPTARQGQGLDYGAPSKNKHWTAYEKHAHVSNQDREKEQYTWREERLAAVIDGIRGLSQLGHYVVLLWPSLACCNVAHAWNPCFPADYIHA